MAKRVPAGHRRLYSYAQPSRQFLLEAKNALANGTIVEMKDERVVDFNAWLDVSIPPTRQNRPSRKPVLPE